MKFNPWKWFNLYRLLYVLAWLGGSFFLLFLNYLPSQPLFSQFLGNAIIAGLAFPVCFYAAYGLTVRYLYNKRIWLFITYSIFSAAANTIITFFVALGIYHLIEGGNIFANFLPLVLAIFLFDVISIAISCIIKIISDRYFMEQQLHQVEKERISTELNFLRSQVNPHFLFNMINTIYFQISERNTNARHSVEKLSEMMRYQLYECTSDKIDIAKELEYINNYVAMQTLRLEKGTDIQLFADDDVAGFFIAPLLILPLIENAFKHITHFRDRSRNQIHITIKKQDGDTLITEVINTYDPAHKEVHLLQSGGLGLQNLNRRLELLYPGRHELTVNKEAETFRAVMKIRY